MASLTQTLKLENKLKQQAWIPTPRGPLPLQTKYKIEQAPHQLIGALAHLLNLNLFHLCHQSPQLPPLVQGYIPNLYRVYPLCFTFLPLETQVLGPHVVF